MSEDSQTVLLKAGRFIANEEQRSGLVKRLGFKSSGEIERFMHASYGKAIAQLHPSDYLKGHMFSLEPAVTEGRIAEPDSLLPILRKIRKEELSAVIGITLDLGSEETQVATPSHTELAIRVGGSWLDTHAQTLSESLDKCVVLASGVTVSVYVSGKLYFELSDVIEGLDKGPQEDFQRLSWNNGDILYVFAEQDLNNRTPVGIWQIADLFLLKPNPESLIQDRLYAFLKYRMHGWVDLFLEAHVENEGRLDVSLQLSNGLIYIIEIKWMGSSLKKSRQTKSKAEIEKARKTHEDWFTEFDESVMEPGFNQVVIYCSSGKFRRGYLAVFDCQSPGKSTTDKNIQIDATATKSQDPSKFRIIRAAVDPRSASTRS